MENLQIIIPWSSEILGLDNKLSLEYGIEIKDKGNMEAIITGNKLKIVDFLTSSDYAMDFTIMYEDFPELLSDYSNIKYALETDGGNIEWTLLDDAIFNSVMYNDENIVIADINNNKIVDISINYDNNVIYKIYDIQTDEIKTDIILRERLRTNYLLKGQLEGIYDNAVGWDTAPRNIIDRIREKNNSIKRTYKDIISEALEEKELEDLNKFSINSEVDIMNIYKDIMNVAILNHSELPKTAFEDILTIDDKIAKWTIDKIKKPFSEIIKELGYTTLKNEAEIENFNLSEAKI